MIWRLLLRSWSRLRDLSLIALIADPFLAGLGSWLALAAALSFASAVTWVMATASATHAKAVGTPNRLGAHSAHVTSQKGQGARRTSPNLVQTDRRSGQPS